MDNYKPVESYWSEHFKEPFTPNEAVVYYYLIEEWRKSGNINPFPVNSSRAELVLNIPKKTFFRCREKLQKRGLITYKEGKGKGKYPYYFLTCDTVSDTVSELSVKVSPTPPSKDNINNNKENNSNELLKKASLPSQESDRMDWNAFMQTFNNMLTSGTIPKIVSLTQTRRNKVKSIVKQFGKHKIMEVFDKIQKSDFLMGRNRSPNEKWKCNFDFIFSVQGFTKILEGNYDNNGAITNQNSGGNYINSGAVQDQPIDIYKEVFGYDGPPDQFEEWFNKHPYGS